MVVMFLSISILFQTKEMLYSRVEYLGKCGSAYRLMVQMDGWMDWIGMDDGWVDGLYWIGWMNGWMDG
jgi:hypothetical protein